MTTTERRHKTWLRKLVVVVFGTDAEPLRQTKMLFAFTATAFLILSLMFNVVSGVTETTLNWIFAAVIPVHLWLWYQGRRFDRVHLMTNGILFTLCFVILPSTWVLNAGSNGPTLIIYTIALTYSVGVYRANDQWLRLIMFGFILTPPVLFLFEIKYPELIHTYQSVSDRTFDIFFTYAMCSASLGILMLGHTRRFLQELKRADELTKQLRELAKHDSLTKLLNHRSILNELSVQVSRTGPLSLMLADIDHFKKINDVHGHLVGDQVLVMFSELMRQLAMDIDGKVGRLGGEEFLIIAAVNSNEMWALDEKLRAQLLVLPDLPVTVTYSAGIVQKESKQDQNDLIRFADTAMYEAKAKGRNQASVWKSSLTNH